MLTRYGAANGKFNVFNQKKIIPAADFLRYSLLTMKPVPETAQPEPRR